MITTVEAQNMFENKKVYLFEIKNSSGAYVLISNYGGTILKICVPNKNGELVDVVLGFDDIKDYYTKPNPYFGACIGRYANRIKEGRFTLNGKEYVLSVNENNNQLHGGIKGFDKKPMYYKILSDNSIKFTLFSKDMEEGFPGNLNADVIYTFTEDNQLKIEYFANTDKDTVVNLTNHSYFNLKGSGDILEHTLQIFGDGFTEIDDKCIPTGKIIPVANTPFDFLQPHKIGERIHADFPQLKLTKGYDHNYAINKNTDNLCAKAYCDDSGIAMEVFTNKPGVQLYTGNSTNAQGKQEYKPYCGFCLETQFFPDSPNVEAFPSCVLKANEKYKYFTTYKFSVK